MLDLKKAGLVKSVRGPKGGYRLSRSQEQISFGAIVRIMEGPIALVSCASVNFYAPCGDCHDEATCAIRRAFTIMRDQSTRRARCDFAGARRGMGRAARRSTDQERGDGAAGRAGRVARSWYWIGATASLMFMLLGCAVYAMHLYTDPATLPLDQRVMFEAEPAWITTMLGLASVLGTLGTLLLLLRRRAAVPLLLASLIVAIIWFVGLFGFHSWATCSIPAKSQFSSSRSRWLRRQILPVRAPLPSARVAPLISLAGSASVQATVRSGAAAFSSIGADMGTVSREICRLGSCER